MLPLYVVDESAYYNFDLRPTSELPDVYDPTITYGPIYTANTFSDLANIPARLNGNGDPDPFLSFAVQSESTVGEVVKPAGVYARTAVGAEWVFTGSCPRRSDGRIALKKVYTFSDHVAIPCSATACWNSVGSPDGDPPIPPFCECNGLSWDGDNYVENTQYGTYSTFQNEVMSTNVLTFNYTHPRVFLYADPLEADERRNNFNYQYPVWMGAVETGSSIDHDFNAPPYFKPWRNFYTTHPEIHLYTLNCADLGALGWSTSPYINGYCGSNGPLSPTCVANFTMTVDFETIPFPS
jgi:hypothetical protein